jgi:hypothetical protein
MEFGIGVGHCCNHKTALTVVVEAQGKISYPYWSSRYLTVKHAKQYERPFLSRP